MPECDAYFPGEIKLSAIDLRQLNPVRQVLRHYQDQDHSRWIFQGRVPGVDEQVFVKIWNPTYVRRDTLPAALAAGFYAPDTTPALRGLLVSNGICRGYVMAAGRRQFWMSRRFFQLVCTRTIESGYFAVQFSPSHTLRHNGNLTMIDLEGIYPHKDLNLVRDHHSAFAFQPYAAFVARLLGAQMPPVEQKPTLSERLAWRIQALRSNSIHTRLRDDLIEA